MQKKLKIINTKYEQLVINIQKKFSISSLSIHKARNEIKIIQFHTQKLVVKSFKIPNIINKLVYTFFRDSKAKKSYNYSLKIIDFVPQPIGYIEFYKCGLLEDSYFISEEFQYDFTIREPLLDINFEDRTNIFKEFAKFTLQLHDNGIFHDDYSPGNILIQKDLSGNYLFKIVDINRMKFGTLSNEKRAKNFSKLWASKDVLTTIAMEYIKYYKTDKSFIEKVIFYSEKNKKIKNFKKRLKGKEIID